MKCPHCGVVCEENAQECAACGLLFAKWRERQERQKREAAEALSLIEKGPARPPNPWTGRVLALAVVVAWTVVLAGLYAWRMSGPKAPSPITESPVEYRDPSTGKMVPVFVSPR